MLACLSKPSVWASNVAAALNKMNELYVERFGKEVKLVKDGAATGKYEHDVDFFYAESQIGLGSVVELRNAFYDVRGMSPKRCAVRARLAEVRRALMVANGTRGADRIPP